MKSLPCITTLAIAATLLTSADASAQGYTFSETCAPITRYATGREAPNVLTILDNSGSMSGTKWNSAVTVMKELADAVIRSGTCNATSRVGCDDIRLGLGYFGSQAWLSVAPADRANGDAIKNSLNGTSPNGGSTRMDLGTALIVNNDTLKDATRTSIAMFITDGTPTNVSGKPSSIQAAANLCAAKTRASAPVVTYVVGFGTGTNTYINSMLAAAGGSGSCKTSAGAPIDVCALSDDNKLKLQNRNSPYSGATCTGALQANSAQALKNALLSIATNAACTFPLTIPANYPAGQGADADPFATKVEINHRIFGTAVEVQPYLVNDPNLFYNYLVNARGVAPSAADPMKGDGWVFADETRRNVRLTPELCQQVAAGNIEIVDTQVACLCEKEGEACSVPGKLGVCQQGVYTCVKGRDVCTQVNFPTTETCNNADDNCNGIVDDIPDAGDDCSVPGKLGRCALGNIACTNGNKFCEQRFEPMPEVCNGLDDNCDGEIDDLDTARTDVNANWTNVTLPTQYNGMVCSFQNTCTCTPAQMRGNTHKGNNLSEYLQQNWQQKCRCVEGVFEAEEAGLLIESDVDAEASADDEVSAGCTIASASQKTPGAELALLGVTALGMVIGRRRRS